MMQNKKYIKEMNYIYFGGVNYIFRLCEAIGDLYTLKEDGFMAIRGMPDNWIDESLEVILKTICIENDIYDFEGSISEWKENPLYIVQLNKKNMIILRDYFNIHKSYYFCAEWISYFKEDEVLIDIGHAFDGAMEQMHLNHKIPKQKIIELEKRRGICIDWSG